MRKAAVAALDAANQDLEQTLAQRTRQLFESRKETGSAGLG